jgi:hypothetical protein
MLYPSRLRKMAITSDWPTDFGFTFPKWGGGPKWPTGKCRRPGKLTRMWNLKVCAVLLLAGVPTQEKTADPLPALKDEPSTSAAARTVEWKEGHAIRVRVPIASPTHQLMTTISFPEESVDAAITGWGEGDVTAVQKKGLLFIRLAKKAEGHLNVIGGSGKHYALYLVGIEETEPRAYDSYLRITREDRPVGDRLPKRREHRPSGAVELIQAMRLGLRTDGAKILRAARELVFESREIEIRLLYVYSAGSFMGHVYEVANRTAVKQAVDSSRLRAKDTRLVLSGLRENVIEPNGSTRLYAIFWKE